MSRVHSSGANKKICLSVGLIGLQFILPLKDVIAAQTLASSSSQPETFQYSEQLSAVAGGLSSDNSSSLKNTTKALATSTASSGVQNWLNQFGTARVQLNVDDNGRWEDSSVDFLLPVYDNKKAVLFTQLGIRAPDGRLTSNIGLGVRTFYLADWMLGGNVFFDHDYDGHNRRVGLGTEAWTNYFKFSANGYFATSDWHSSQDFTDYEEKPADGFDIRAEGYLPAYPQLGARVMYEKYYGDEVALFDKDDRQKNPSAVTVGLSYTPIPLITAAIDYKRGQCSLDETHFSLNLRYEIGQSWQSQLSPDNVALRRSLAGSRYDLVDRNNTIILQYKKKSQESAALADMTLSSANNNSPADGVSANKVTLHAVMSDGRPAKNAAVSWSVTGSGVLSVANSVTDSSGNASVELTNTTAQTVTVTASAGNIVRSTTSSFAASAVAVDLQLSKNNSQANGTDQNIGTVTVLDSAGKPVSHAAVNWKVNNGARLVQSDNSTDDKGSATASFTSTTAGTVMLTAVTENQSKSVNASFGQQQQRTITVTTLTNNQTADGHSQNVVQAVVTDETGRPVEGENVVWSNTGSATPTTSTTAMTDHNGKATLSLTDAKTENIIVNAKTASEAGHAAVSFVNAEGQVATVQLTAKGSGSQSDPVVYTAITRNAAGKVVPGAYVVWSGDITESKEIVCDSRNTVTNAAGRVSETCYNRSFQAVLNVNASVVVGARDAVDPNAGVMDDMTQDFAASP